MKRTLAITAVFVVLNGLGVVYRLVVKPGEPAGAITAPITPAMASELPLEPAAHPAAVDPPAITVSTPDPPASEIQTPVPQGTWQTGKQKSPVGSRPAKPAAASKVGQQRRPGTDSHSALTARPRVAPTEPDRTAAPASVPVAAPPSVPPPTLTKPDNNVRNEDSLRKMEANPYKRGE